MATKATEWSVRDNAPHARFRMSVKGGDLPANVEFFIDVDMSFKDAKFEDYKDFIAGGQSGRVVLQGMLRKQPLSVLRRLQERGLNIHVTMLGNPNAVLTAEDQAAIVTRYLESLPKEIREQALKDLVARAQ